MNLAERSKLLTGNRHRLAIGRELARHSTITVREIAQATGVPDNIVRSEFGRFVELGLLSSLPRASRERYYERHPDPFWDYCVTEVDGLTSEMNTPTAPAVVNEVPDPIGSDLDGEWASVRIIELESRAEQLERDLEREREELKAARRKLAVLAEYIAVDGRRAALDTEDTS